MKIYRVTWWMAVAGILLIGVGVCWRLPAQALLVLFLGSGGLCAVLIYGLGFRRDSHTPGGRSRVVATSAVLGGMTAVSFAGFSDLLGAGVLALVVFFSLSSPAAVRILGRGLRGVHRPSAMRLETLGRAFSYVDLGYVTLPSPPPPEPCALTDEELSRGWQTSSRALRRRTSPANKVAVVEARQTYLEEFERRNPSGFAAWLTSASGASDDLMSFLSQGGVEDATINWDELTWGRD